MKRIHTKFPEVKAIITYSHYQRGFHGIIYQACGFLYLGYSQTSVPDYIINGKRYDLRKVVKIFGSSKKETLEKIDPKYSKIPKLGFHRYVYIYHQYKEEIIPTIRYPILDYPKAWRKHNEET